MGKEITPLNETDDLLVEMSLEELERKIEFAHVPCELKCQCKGFTIVIPPTPK
jgi:hypothetical protein